MAWNTDIFVTNECRLCSEYAILTDIVAAVNERCSAAGIALLSTDIRLASTYTVCAAIQTKVTALIAAYVNHTDNGGNWDGQAAIPAWTEATILTAIGAASRLPATRLYVSAEWAEQQYKILNLLRWTKPVWNVLNLSNPEGKFGTDPTWSVAVSNFNAAAWIANTDSYPYHYTTTGFNIYRQRHSATITNTTAYRVDYQFYALFRHLIPGLFEDNDYSSSDTKLKNIQSGEITAGNSAIFSIGNFNNNSLSEPSPDRRSWYTETGNYVYKFDGANGFTYKDW